MFTVETTVAIIFKLNIKSMTFWNDIDIFDKKD